MGILLSYFSKLLTGRDRHILILGLDNAGKTTILYRLQVGEVVSTIPTIGFNVESVTYKNLRFQVWDLGGQTSIRFQSLRYIFRPYWRCYYSNADAVIYVIDSMDRDRVSLTSKELSAILQEEELNSVPLCILANKQDIEGCMPVAEIASKLNLVSIKNRKWQIFETSAIKGSGLEDSMDWLSTELLNKK